MNGFSVRRIITLFSTEVEGVTVRMTAPVRRQLWVWAHGTGGGCLYKGVHNGLDAHECRSMSEVSG